MNKAVSKIADRMVAHFHYTLTNAAGKVIDSSREREPLPYLHGAGNIVPGLESAMTGRVAGDKFKIAVAPEQGYGKSNPQLVQQVPREAFPEGAVIEVGMQFEAHGPQGAIPVSVTKVSNKTITVDANHPLAGQTLHFDIEVIEVRDATVEELAHGHVHGAGGHEH